MLPHDRNNDRKPGWGILGTGRIAQQFAQDFSHVPNGELRAVCSRSLDSARGFAAKYGLAAAHGSYQALLDSPDVDVVYIASPHSFHYRNMVSAVSARKHVLCEKPFTVGVEESRNLFHLADRSSVFVMEAMWTYFLPAIQKAQEWVAQGRIGPIQQVKADFGYPQRPYSADRREYNAALGGGCLLEMGIYPVALAWLFLQRDPDDIQVIARKAPNGVEDDLQMLFSYGNCDSGVSANLATSFRSKLPNIAYIIGEDSCIVIPDFWRASQCSLYRLDDCIDHYDDGRASLGLNFQAIAVNEDIRAGRLQNAVMPWSTTMKFQQHMARVLDMI